jgi:glycosyltransferase involved in cell wall biosynthesis
MRSSKTKKKLVIVTTVPITLKVILVNQPKFLSKYFDLSIISSPSSEFSEIEEAEQVPCFKLSMQRGISPIKDLVSLFKMIKTLHNLKPDIVHSYTPKAGLITMLAGFICRVPVRVHTFTGLIFPTSTGVKQKLLMWMDRLVCACATTIVPEGQGVKKDLIDYAITRKPLAVIGSGNIAGVDTSFFNKQQVIDEELHLPLFRQLNLPKCAFLFCFVGRFTQDKGFTELLTAFNELPENAHLLLVGEMDERLPLSRDLAQTLNNHSRIHNIGWQDDIRPALAISNLLVLPSYREGFPNTPLQAGAMELPCIVTDINGSNEIIERGFNGWVVPVKNSEALADAMVKSMQEINLSKLGKQARNNIREKFEQQTHWQNMLSFYQEHLEKLSIK